MLCEPEAFLTSCQSLWLTSLDFPPVEKAPPYSITQMRKLTAKQYECPTTLPPNNRDPTHTETETHRQTQKCTHTEIHTHTHTKKMGEEDGLVFFGWGGKGGCHKCPTVP